MCQVLFKIMVSLTCRKHAGSSDPDIFEVAVPVRNNGADASCFGIGFQQVQDIFKTDTKQFAIFKRLDIVLAFLLPKKAFKQYDYMVLFHKPRYLN